MTESNVLTARFRSGVATQASSGCGKRNPRWSVRMAFQVCHGGRICRRRSWFICRRQAAMLLVAFLTAATLTTVSRAQAVLGGHVGVAFPLVTRTTGAAESPADTTTINDSFNIIFPFGVSVVPKGSPVVYDFEFVPEIHPSTRSVTLLVHPGVIRPLPQHWAVGIRAAFEVDQSSIGFTPLVNKSFPISGHKTRWFVEGDLPVRFLQKPNQQNATSVGIAAHVGLSF